MMHRLVCVSVLLLGCKYGGSDQDPSMGYEPGQSIEPDDTLDASSSKSDDDDSPPKPPTRGSALDSGKPATTGDNDAGKRTEDPPIANACAPTIAMCDPVRNTGCPPLMQCDIDTGASTPTGRCVFPSTPSGGQCTSSFVNVGCAAQNTCVAGQCRKMCYCDADCPQGQACSDASGPGPAGAFKLCI